MRDGSVAKDRAGSDVHRTTFEHDLPRLDKKSDDARIQRPRFRLDFRRWWGELARQRLRLALSMLGVCVGIAAANFMSSLGSFTEQRILEGYEELGVNNV